MANSVKRKLPSTNTDGKRMCYGRCLLSSSAWLLSAGAEIRRKEYCMFVPTVRSKPSITHSMQSKARIQSFYNEQTSQEEGRDEAHEKGTSEQILSSLSSAHVLCGRRHTQTINQQSSITFFVGFRGSEPAATVISYVIRVYHTKCMIIRQVLKSGVV